MIINLRAATVLLVETAVMALALSIDVECCLEASYFEVRLKQEKWLYL